MRLILFALIVGAGLLGGRAPEARAEEGEDLKPVRVHNLTDVAALDVGTLSLHMSNGRGMTAAVVKRCPNLARLHIEHHTDLNAGDLRPLVGLKSLRVLTLFGDLTIDDEDLKVIGTMTQLEGLNLAIG